MWARAHRAAVTPLRAAALICSLVAIPIALYAPWVHVTDHGSCFFADCRPQPPSTHDIAGDQSGGFVASACLVFASVGLALVSHSGWRMGVVGAPLAIAAILGLVHGDWPTAFLFKSVDYAWGSVATGLLSVGAFGLASGDLLRQSTRANRAVSTKMAQRP